MLPPHRSLPSTFRPSPISNLTPRVSVRRVSGQNPTPGRSPLRLWPFIAITVLGSWSYVYLVNARTGEGQKQKVIQRSGSPQLAAPTKDTPAFSPEKVSVVFVLGGPGAGKGTQCANIVKGFGFTHLSAGDLLRAEQEREGSEFGELIKENIKEGKIVPMEVTVQLLENAMTEDMGSKGEGKFLIDGFPRKMDQALKFEETVCKSKFTLFFDLPEDVMQERLLKRGKTSGRSDDNEESIKKRFKVFEETSMPVVDMYEKEGRVVKISASDRPSKVYELVKAELISKGFEPKE